MEVQILPVQQQTNNMDCCLFAIANAFEQLASHSPQNAIYNINRMRYHLVQVFSSEHMEATLFPKNQRKAVHCSNQNCINIFINSLVICKAQFFKFVPLTS